MNIEHTYTDAIGQPTFVVDGAHVCIMGDKLIGTLGRRKEIDAIANLIYALGPRCDFRWMGMTPPCALPLHHTGPHEDGFGGFYGNGAQS